MPADTVLLPVKTLQSPSKDDVKLKIQIPDASTCIYLTCPKTLTIDVLKSSLSLHITKVFSNPQNFEWEFGLGVGVNNNKGNTLEEMGLWPTGSIYIRRL
jgi:hypothetical protein